MLGLPQDLTPGLVKYRLYRSLLSLGTTRKESFSYDRRATSRKKTASVPLSINRQINEPDRIICDLIVCILWHHRHFYPTIVEHFHALGIVVGANNTRISRVQGKLPKKVWISKKEWIWFCQMGNGAWGERRERGRKREGSDRMNITNKVIEAWNNIVNSWTCY